MNPCARLALAGWLLVPSVVWAEGDSHRRAVRAWSGELHGGYAHTSQRGFPASSLSDGTTETGAWNLGGTTTVPIASAFGMRVGLDGGQTDATGATLVFGVRAEDWRVGAGVDLFWRDPDKGYVEVGYAYERTGAGPLTRTSPIQPMIWIYPRPFEQNVHSVRGGAGLFVGPIDLDVDVAYSPRMASAIESLDPTQTDSIAERVKAGAGPRWYVADWIALSARFEYTRVEQPRTLISFVPVPPSWLPPNVAHSDVFSRYAGRFSAVIQPPVMRAASIDLFAGVGDHDAPYTRRSEPVSYAVGFALRVRYPAPESLRAWYREYR